MTKSAENTGPAENTAKKDPPTGSPVTAATPGMEGKGSPVTAASPPADKSNDVTQTPVQTQSTKQVVGGETTKPDPDHKTLQDAPKKLADDEGDPPEMTAKEQRELEKILDGGEDNDDGASEENTPATTKPNNESAALLFRLLRAAGPQTPDEHIVWGIADNRLTVGDLRNLARMIR